MVRLYNALLILIVIAFAPRFAYAQLAKDKCKYLGNVIANSVPADFDTYWNQVTPENGGKWGSVEATRDVMNWTDLDRAYNYAQEKGFPFKQHTFIWGNQQPSWIESLPAEEQLQEIEEWMQAYCERYPNTDFIDVVNEPIHDAPQGTTNGNYIEALGGTGLTGWNWVIKSFELARQYCPNAKLLLNEYGIINDNNRTTQYLTIINLLKERELIDGIGVQGHRFELEGATNTTLTNNLNRLGQTGLPIHISEFDLGNVGGTGSPNDAQQLQLYERIFPLLWNHSAVEGITLWGYREGAIWQQTAYLKRNDGTERPAFNWLKTFVPNSSGSNYCIPITSIDESEAHRLVYPNPVVDGKFFVSVPSGAKRISILDSRGKIVTERTPSGMEEEYFELDVPQGFYLLRIHEQTRSYTTKLIFR